MSSVALTLSVRTSQLSAVLISWLVLCPNLTSANELTVGSIPVETACHLAPCDVDFGSASTESLFATIDLAQQAQLVSEAELAYRLPWPVNGVANATGASGPRLTVLPFPTPDAWYGKTRSTDFAIPMSSCDGKFFIWPNFSTVVSSLEFAPSKKLVVSLDKPKSGDHDDAPANTTFGFGVMGALLSSVWAISRQRKGSDSSIASTN